MRIPQTKLWQSVSALQVFFLIFKCANFGNAALLLCEDRGRETFWASGDRDDHSNYLAPAKCSISGLDSPPRNAATDVLRHKHNGRV